MLGGIALLFNYFFSIFNQGTKRKGFGGIQAQQSLSQTQAEQRGSFLFVLGFH